MDTILQDKRILIAVSGGIAIYKILDLISTLKKANAKVRVVMTPSATRFIAPLTFEALSGEKVLCEASESWQEDAPNHISYARFCDVALLAPASVDSIAKLRHGISDNLALSTILALPLNKCKVFIAPSANTNMIESAQNTQNLLDLSNMGYAIIPPRVTRLACDVVANGAMAETSEIVFHLKKALYPQNDALNGKEIIITGGGSIEQIDPIRHISNNSSGKQASYLALACYYAGAKVRFISSRFPIRLPLGIECVQAHSGESFTQAIESCITKNSILLMCAAISDYVPKNVSQHKLKKETLGLFWNLECVQSEDILRKFTCAYKVGFKAESDKNSALEAALRLLKSINQDGKGCDMAVLNIIDESNVIGGDENEIEIFTQDSHTKISKQDKFAIARAIVSALIENLTHVKS